MGLVRFSLLVAALAAIIAGKDYVIDRFFSKPYPVPPADGAIIITGKSYHYLSEGQEIVKSNRHIFTRLCSSNGDGWETLMLGASTGIGLHAAVVLAQKGYTVFAGVRKQADADNLKEHGIATLRPVILDVEQEVSHHLLCCRL